MSLCWGHVHTVHKSRHRMPMVRMHVVEDRAGARRKFARYETEIGTDNGCMFPSGARVGAKKKRAGGEEQEVANVWVGTVYRAMVHD